MYNYSSVSHTEGSHEPIFYLKISSKPKNGVNPERGLDYTTLIYYYQKIIDLLEFRF